MYYQSMFYDNESAKYSGEIRLSDCAPLHTGMIMLITTMLITIITTIMLITIGNSEQECDYPHTSPYIMFELSQTSGVST